MPTMTVQETTNVLGYAFPANETITADGAVVKEVTSLAEAKIGQLTTRTDNDTGTLTMNSGHGITTGQRLDVFWSTGARLGMTVGTVATNSVPIDGGMGDNLPTNLTAVTAQVPQEEEFIFTGSNAAALAYYANRQAGIVLAKSDNSAADYAIMNGTKKSQIWTPSRNATIPTSGDAVTKVFFSNGDSGETATVRAVALFS